MQRIFGEREQPNCLADVRCLYAVPTDAGHISAGGEGALMEGFFVERVNSERT